MKLTILVLLALLAGCAMKPIKVQDHSSALLMPITAAQRDLATHDYSAVSRDLQDAATAATSIAREDVETQTALAKDESFIQQHHNDYLGARTHRIERWIAIIGIPLATIIGGLLIYSGNATALSAVAHTVIVVLSGGLHAVTLAVVWIVGKFRGNNR